MSTRPSCALPLLCLVQGSERFAFFAVFPLLVLYMQRHLGMAEHSALLLLGCFLALSYLACVPAGFLADRWLGSFGSILVGSICLATGYGILALDRTELLWLALSLQLIGHGLFKPGISVSTGHLYPVGDARRERSFMAQHIAVNVGAMAGPLCSEWSRARGWPTMFRWAACGMVAAILGLLVGHRWLASASPHRPAVSPFTVVASAARSRTRAIRLLCLVGAVFYLTAQQAGTSLALFAERYTRSSSTWLHRSLELGPGHFASLHGLLVVILMTPLLAVFAALRRRDCEPSAIAKMTWGYVVTAAAFVLMMTACLHGGDTGRVSPAWLTGCYVLMSLAELLLAPMSLSLITQLAPPGKSARLVGLWLAATAAGNALAGALGFLWGSWPNHRYFALLVIGSLGAALVLLIKKRSLDRTLGQTATVA